MISVYFIPRKNLAEIQCRESLVLEPDAIAKIIAEARRPILVTGGKLLENDKLVEYAVKFYKKGIPIVATGASSKPLIERGVKPLAILPLHKLAQYVQDEHWNGFDNKGRHDVYIFMGFHPYFLNRILSAFKHFTEFITVSIDEFYQPNASYSLASSALVVKEDACIGCGNCVVACPHYAIRLQQSIIKNGKRLVIDVRYCRDCEVFACLDSCPYDAIEYRNEYYKALNEILEYL